MVREPSVWPVLVQVILTMALGIVMGMNIEAIRAHDNAMPAYRDFTITDRPKCEPGQALHWEGAAWKCADVPSALTITGISNVIPKGNGATLTNSAITDDGSSTYLNLLGGCTRWVQDGDATLLTGDCGH